MKLSYLMLLIGFGLFLFVIKSIGIYIIYESFSSLSLITLFALLLLVLINTICMSLRWSYILEKLNVKLKLKYLINLISFSFLFNQVVPSKSGDIFLRPILLKKQKKIPYNKSIPTTFFDRFLDISLMFLVTFLFIYPFIREFTVFGIIFSIIALFMMRSFIMRKTYNLILKFYERFPKKIKRDIPKKKAASSLKTMWKNFKLLPQSFNISKILILTLILLIVNFLEFYIVLQHFIPDVNWFLAMGLFYTSFVIGIFSMIPGGLGASELSIVGLSLLVNIPPEISLVGLLVYRVSNIIVFGLMYFLTIKHN